MGIDEFENSGTLEAKVKSSDIDNSDIDKVRPYVSKEVHEKVNEFSANSGLPMYDSYNIILEKAIDDTGLLEEILITDREYSDTLSDSEKELLSELASKAEDLGRFPTREEINQDSDLNGFPIYITYLGERSTVKHLIKDRYPDVL